MMQIIRTPQELAATVREVAAGLPSHRQREIHELQQAADILGAIAVGGFVSPTATHPAGSHPLVKPTYDPNAPTKPMGKPWQPMPNPFIPPKAPPPGPPNITEEDP